MDATPGIESRNKPRISIAASDHARLLALADAISERDGRLADVLFAELERAEIVSDEALQGNVVRMGSKVRFTDEKGVERTVVLVFPRDADVASGRLSILTPVGTALIGLSSGQSLEWTARDGQQHRLTVLDVEPPSAGN